MRGLVLRLRRVCFGLPVSRCAVCFACRPNSPWGFAFRVVFFTSCLTRPQRARFPSLVCCTACAYAAKRLRNHPPPREDRATKSEGQKSGGKWIFPHSPKKSPLPYNATDRIVCCFRKQLCFVSTVITCTNGETTDHRTRNTQPIS